MHTAWAALHVTDRCAGVDSRRGRWSRHRGGPRRAAKAEVHGTASPQNIRKLAEQDRAIDYRRDGWWIEPGMMPPRAGGTSLRRLTLCCARVEGWLLRDFEYAARRETIDAQGGAPIRQCCAALT